MSNYFSWFYKECLESVRVMCTCVVIKDSILKITYFTAFISPELNNFRISQYNLCSKIVPNFFVWGFIKLRVDSTHSNCKNNIWEEINSIRMTIFNIFVENWNNEQRSWWSISILNMLFLKTNHITRKSLFKKRFFIYCSFYIRFFTILIFWVSISN